MGDHSKASGGCGFKGCLIEFGSESRYVRDRFDAVFIRLGCFQWEHNFLLWCRWLFILFLSKWKIEPIWDAPMILLQKLFFRCNSWTVLIFYMWLVCVSSPSHFALELKILWSCEIISRSEENLVDSFIRTYRILKVPNTNKWNFIHRKTLITCKYMKYKYINLDTQ